MAAAPGTRVPPPAGAGAAGGVVTGAVPGVVLGTPLGAVDDGAAPGMPTGTVPSSARRTPVAKYSVSPKHEVGTPLCCSYVIATRAPSSCWICAATASSRTEYWNSSGACPGTLESAISPSHVLQSQPLRESFWLKPTRWPSE